MLRLPPRSTRTDTLFPYTTLFRSLLVDRRFCRIVSGPNWSAPDEAPCLVTATVGPGMTSRAEIEAVAEEAAERAVDKAMQRWFTTVGIAAGNPRDIQETQADFAWLRGRRRGETKVTIAITRSEEHTSELQSLMR